MSSTQQLVQSVVVVLIFIPIFWQIRRKVRDGRLAPNARRTNHHSRTYIVVIASLNVVVVVFFVTSAVVSFINGQWSFGLSLLLLAALVGTFVWMLFRQGTELRREGLPDRAPSVMQRSMSRRRRVTGFVTGGLAGLTLVTVVPSAFDRDWAAVVVAAVVGSALWAISWWVYRPARVAEKAGA
jgi:FtsH-binding integral membrane protein